MAGYVTLVCRGSDDQQIAVCQFFCVRWRWTCHELGSSYCGLGLSQSDCPAAYVERQFDSSVARPVAACLTSCSFPLLYFIDTVTSHSGKAVGV
jgi:hypothetical protein